MRGGSSSHNSIGLLKRILLISIVIAIAVVSEYIDEAILSSSVPSGQDIFPSWISSVDEHLFLFINVGLANAFLRTLFQLLTHLGSTLAIVTLCLALYFLGYRRDAFLILVSVLIGTVITLPIKVFIPRPRPYMTLPMAIPLEREAGSSFPSGHSERAFALAVVLSRKRPRLTFPICSLAILVAFSRIYIGVHYPFDVAFGSAIGWMIGKTTLRYEHRLEKSLKRLYPELF